AGRDSRRAAGQLAERSLLHARHRRRRPRRLCALRRPAAQARTAPRRRGARHADLAGLQLHRLERGRVGDSWYVSGRTHAIDLTRPFLDFGIPFRFHDWDLTFLTWLQQTAKSVDYLTDEDIDATTGDELARDYDLVVFPGHEEYVTAGE